jgi:hypothetical protein
MRRTAAVGVIKSVQRKNKDGSLTQSGVTEIPEAAAAAGADGEDEGEKKKKVKKKKAEE